MNKTFDYNNASISLLIDDSTGDPYIKMEYKGIVRRIDTSVVEMQDYLPMVRKKMDESMKIMLSESRVKKIVKIRNASIR